jgi:DNA-binding transcriptional ArsR family regulator
MFLVETQSESAPDLWQALADPTRRHLIDRLASGPRTTSQLCEGMPMSRFGVMKHLGILERAGLVIARRHGRLRFNHLNAAPLHALQARWLSPRAAAFAGGATDFAATLEGKKMTDPKQTGAVDIALEWPIGASVQRVWEALFQRPDTWWPSEHRALGPDSVMTFEARIGAALREERGGQGLAWYSVMAIEPQRSVDLVGHLAARYGGPATSLLHLELVPGEREGSSLLKLTDSIYGRIGPDFQASTASGWESIIGAGLVAEAEKAAAG